MTFRWRLSYQSVSRFISPNLIYYLIRVFNCLLSPNHLCWIPKRNVNRMLIVNCLITRMVNSDGSHVHTEPLTSFGSFNTIIYFPTYTLFKYKFVYFLSPSIYISHTSYSFKVYNFLYHVFDCTHCKNIGCSNTFVSISCYIFNSHCMLYVVKATSSLLLILFYAIY